MSNPTFNCPECNHPGALLKGNCTRCGRERTALDNDRIRTATDALLREHQQHRAQCLEWGGSGYPSDR